MVSRLRPNAPRPRDLRNERTLRKWLDKEWERLAFFAYASYLAHGRGAVGFELGTPGCRFVTYTDGEVVPADLRGVLDGYNPQTQLICHFQDGATAKERTAQAVLVSQVAHPEKWPAKVAERFWKRH